MAATDGVHPNVAIIGAGVAGLALAIALHNHNIPFMLYEEAAQYSAVGAGIGLGPNGLQAMDIIEPRFRPKYETICTGNRYEKDRNVFFEGLLLQKGFGLDQDWARNNTWGSSRYERKSAHRKELLDILTSFVPSACVRFNCKLTQIEERSTNDMVLTFEDGHTATAAILVGSDGIQSLGRRFVLEVDRPEQVKPVYANMYTYRGIVPIEDARAILGDLTDTAKMYFGRNAHCVTYRISEGREFNFLLSIAQPGCPFPGQDALTQRVTREEMMADFRGHNVDERILRLLDWASPVRWGLFHHQQTSTFYRHNVALLGDSAHASLPFQAAGAGQGIEDALVLSHVLAFVYSKFPDGFDQNLKLSLFAYDAIRRPRAQHQVDQSADFGLLINFQHPIGASDMATILLLLQDGRFDWLWFHSLQADLEKADVIMAGNKGVSDVLDC